MITLGDERLPRRVWQKIRRARKGSWVCWEWRGYRSRKGYGRVWWEGKAQWAHRVIYIKVRGEVDKSLVIDHKCQNPACCNPRHLQAITVAQNNQLRYSRRRVS